MPKQCSFINAASGTACTRRARTNGLCNRHNPKSVRGLLAAPKDANEIDHNLGRIQQALVNQTVSPQVAESLIRICNMRLRALEAALAEQLNDEIKRRKYGK